MAMETQLISSAGIAYVPKYGAVSVKNVRFSIGPTGFAAGKVGFARASNYSVTGLMVRLDTFNAPTHLNFRLDFTPQLRPIVLSSIEPPLVPAPVLKNGALSVRPTGIIATKISKATIISDGTPFTQLNFTTLPSNTMSLQMAWGGGLLVNKAGGFDSSKYGRASLAQFDQLDAVGIAGGNPSKNTLISFDVPALSLSLNFTDVGQPASALSFAFDGPMLVSAKGVAQTLFGGATIEVGSLAARVTGIAPPRSSTLALVSHDTKALNIAFDFTVVKNQNGENVAMTFYLEAEPNIFGSGFDSFTSGSHYITIPSNQNITFDGLAHTLYGTPALKKLAATIAPDGFIATRYGANLAYNLKQFAPLQGRTQSLYGTAFMQGGVKTVLIESIVSTSINGPIVVNTSANRQLLIKAIEAPVMPAPVITPHMLYAPAIYQGSVGEHDIRTSRIVLGRGNLHTLAGTPTIWYHTRPLAVNGFESFDTGYPKIKDAAQVIQQAPSTKTAVFGDIAIRNASQFARDAGAIDDMVVSEWTTIVNVGRYVAAKGFTKPSIGTLKITNKSPALSFTGIAAPIFYAPAIGYRIRTVLPAGFDRLQLGSVGVIKTPELKPTGFNAGTIGSATISNYTRYIQHDGLDQQKHGSHTAWFRYRYINAKSFDVSIVNGATLTHGVREVISNGFVVDSYGQPWVSLGTRTVKPDSVYKETYSYHYVGRHQQIKPLGYVATLFGTRITPDSQSVYPQGAVGAWGLTTAELKTRYIKPAGYISVGQQAADRWGGAKFYNLTQYVQQEFDVNGGLVPPPWSDWTLIENKNKQVRAIGVNTARFGYYQIDNNAAPLLPPGIEPPQSTRFERAAISHAIRFIPLQGIEPPHISTWTRTHNAARIVAPAGALQSLFGYPGALKTRRYYPNIGRIESQDFGEPMIADRIRTIDIEKRYSIAPPIVRLPTIDLLTKYVDVAGYETDSYGSPSISIHFNIIKTQWAHREKSGNPILRNVTPELLTNGRDTSEFGDTAIRTEWRDVYARGDDTSRIGLLKIADTKQSIAIAGWRDTVTSQRHTVIRLGTNPYALQNIFLNNESSPELDGFGIRPPQEQVSKPGFNQNVLYPKTKDVSSSFGNAFVWTNNIIVYGGIAIDGVSDQVSVFNALQHVGPKSIASAGSRLGNPRLSPHTIWAVMDAPKQARENHPTRQLHYIDSESVFGTPSIEGKLRFIRHSSTYGTRTQYGTPAITLKKNILLCDGFRSARFGLPSIPFTLQEIEVREGIFNDNRWGGTEVTRPPYVGPQLIGALGLGSQNFGKTAIDNFIRHLSPRGLDALNMGTKKQYDTPYMWQGLRIGAHVPLIISGGDTSKFGTAFISNWIREVTPVGLNAFVSSYDLSNFNNRMKVSNKQSVDTNINTKKVYVNGVDSLLMGEASIRLNQQFIRPDGNSDQFRKGGYHA